MRIPLPVALAALVVSLVAPHAAAQEFVVANRAAGNVTVHGAQTGAERLTVPLPFGPLRPEPMYVQQVGDEVLVGDRANDRVVRLSKDDYAVLGTIPVGDGVFHMWAGPDQLWVTDDIGDAAFVVDTASMSVLEAVRMPADLVADGYKPHDVFVGDDFAWVSLLGGSGVDDWVVQFSKATLEETGRAAVGGDPHLWWDARSDRLFVPSQETGEVAVLDGTSLAPLDLLAIPGAHGVFQPAATDSLLIADIEGGGRDDLLALDIFARSLDVADSESTEVPTAHNIAASASGRRIMVTHSGATSTAVTLYALEPSLLPLPRPGAQLQKLAELQADLNPFGLAYVE